MPPASARKIPSAAADDIGALDARIALRLRRKRLEQEWTLDQLAEKSGVSRAMISKIERGEASPTAVLLAKLSHALGYGLSAFIDEAGPAEPLMRRAAQTVWRDPATGYLRRNVSPAGFAGMEIVEIELPPGARVMFDHGYPLPLSRFVWVLEGELVMTLDHEAQRLSPGDCLHLRLDQPLTYHNPGKAPTRYALVTESAGRRTRSGDP